MKIIYIYTALTTKGGADRILAEKANSLAALGHDVALVTDSQAGRPPAFPLSPQVRLIDLGINFGQQYGHPLPVRAYLYFALMRRYRRALTAVLKAEKADIVITTLGRDLDFLTSIRDGSIKIGESHIARQYSRNFHLMEQKGFPHRQIARFWRKKQERAVARLDALVLLTQRDAEAWKGVVSTYVIPNLLTLQTDRQSTCLNKKAICVGRLNEQKGLDYLISAWETVSRKHPDWHLDIYGNGELRDSLNDEIRRRSLQETAEIHAAVSDIAEKYLESSICIMTSRYEGFGLVLIEAMECGIPCVAFDCPHGPSEIITNGVDGYVTPYLDCEELASKVCTLMEDDDLRVRMGTQAKKNIQRYANEPIMKQWTGLFEELCRQRRK